MYAYIARQPIYNANKEARGYELFYRDANNRSASNILDGDAATRSVLSEATSVFGLKRLGNDQKVYIHFTRNLILNDFVRLADPAVVAVEMMADITADNAVARKLEELRALGYTLVLSDYDGHGRYAPILPLINIVRINFRKYKREEQRRFARKLLKVPVTILAERIETQADFDAARDMGCMLFQGYYFEKPRLLNAHIARLTDSAYGLLLRELLRPNVDFDACAELIRSDAAMSYLMLQKAGFQDNFGGNILPDIQRMLVQMGQGDLLRYVLLVLAHENNATGSEDLVRQACQRGLFLQGMMESAGLDGTEGFLLGMFSLLDRILDTRMENLVQDIGLGPGIQAALTTDTGNGYAMWLQYVMLYEMANPRLILPKLPIQMTEAEVRELYQRCGEQADEMLADLSI